MGLSVPGAVIGAVIGAGCSWGRSFLAPFSGFLAVKAQGGDSCRPSADERGDICEKSAGRTPGFPLPPRSGSLRSRPKPSHQRMVGLGAARFFSPRRLQAPPRRPDPPPLLPHGAASRRRTQRRTKAPRSPRTPPPGRGSPKNGRVRREPLTGAAEADGGGGPRGDGGCEGLARRRFLPRAADKMAAAGSAPRSAPPRAPHSAHRPAPTAQPRGQPYANGVAIGRAVRPPRPLTPLRRCANGADGRLRS